MLCVGQINPTVYLVRKRCGGFISNEVIHACLVIEQRAGIPEMPPKRHDL